MSILEFLSPPPTWSMEIILQTFDITTSTMVDFVDLCERLEMAKGFE